MQPGKCSRASERVFRLLKAPQCVFNKAGDRGVSFYAERATFPNPDSAPGGVRALELLRALEHLPALDLDLVLLFRAAAGRRLLGEGREIAEQRPPGARRVDTTVPMESSFQQ